MPISLFADHTALIKTLISDSLNTPCTLNAPFWQQRSRNWSVIHSLEPICVAELQII